MKTVIEPLGEKKRQNKGEITQKLFSVGSYWHNFELTIQYTIKIIKIASCAKTMLWFFVSFREFKTASFLRAIQFSTDDLLWEF